MQFLKERINKIANELLRISAPQEIGIDNFKYIRTKERYSDIANLDTGGWESFDKGSFWGGHRDYYWFDAEVTIPKSLDGKCVFFKLTTGKEGSWDLINPQFAFYINGELCQGLDVNHRDVLIAEKACAGERYRITLSAFTGDENENLMFDARLIETDMATQRLYYDIEVPLRVAELLGEQHPEYPGIIKTLNNTINILDLREEYSSGYYASLLKAQEYITASLYEKNSESGAPVVCCTGHTHIDIAWLWTLAVTEDKAVRSFSTVIKLMEEYPEYIFMSSQPQLYKYVKKNEPELYEKIKDRIKEGRWEPEGGMFVEADCNIASGESLVRQILYGKRFFKSEFGADNKVLWLPDVFGYSAALPQIMKKSGLEYFMTTKISWNEYNKMPYDTFEWIGIDGSKVLTHFIPASEYKSIYKELDSKSGHYTTYNGVLNPSQVMGGWQRYQQKHLNRDVLMAFGYGDGGGGPTRRMLENQRRLEAGIPGAPKTKMSTVRGFFQKLENDVQDSPSLPSWTGELYLEYHRGTYTSMARNKKLNRRSEFAAQNAEWMSALNTRLNAAVYPEYILNDVWEKLMRNQFHDILPGSSIKEVYDDAADEYASLLGSTKTVINQAMVEIASRVGNDLKDGEAEQKHRSESQLVVFNPNGFKASGTADFSADFSSGNLCVLSGDEEFLCQKTGEGRYLAYLKDIPAKGYKSFKLNKQKKNKSFLSEAFSGKQKSKSKEIFHVSENFMENDFFEIKLNEKGQFSSIYDKRCGRELIKSNSPANVIMSYEDKPHNWDAWDINSYYSEKSWPVDDVYDICVKEAGPLRGCVEAGYKYLDSEIKVSIFIWKDLPRIDLKYEIEWKQKQILLKSLFPLDIHSDKADFDIQYGNVTRPTHKNTSWDRARFEVCMHKWMDISEDGYGVSILNDSKYGCSVDHNEIGVTLLKSPIYPNPEADKEHHEFIISLFPHAEGWRSAGTVKEAYLINNPLMAVSTDELPKMPGKKGELPGSFSFAETDKDNVIIEAIKKAEDSNGWIIRMYECYNRRTKAHIKLAWEADKITECDLLENDIEKIAENSSALSLTFLPYEIKTIKVSFAE